jgi:hypothetical protein
LARGPEDKVDQNGTHYLFGCYDNTLDMAKVSYAELAAAGNKDFGLRLRKRTTPRCLIGTGLWTLRGQLEKSG